MSSQVNVGAFNPKEITNTKKSDSLVEPKAKRWRGLVVKGALWCRPHLPRLWLSRFLLTPQRWMPLGKGGRRWILVGKFEREWARFQDGLVTSLEPGLPCRPRTSLPCRPFPTGQEPNSFLSVVSTQVPSACSCSLIPVLWAPPASRGARLPKSLLPDSCRPGSPVCCSG